MAEGITKWEFYIAGVQHHEIHRCLKEMEVGEGLVMRPEPTNKFDKNAVRLEYPLNDLFVMIGYVPGKISVAVADSLRRPGKMTECRIVELNKEERPWKQIKVSIMKKEE